MDASEDDQLAAAIAASMEGNNDVSDEEEMEQVEDIMDQEEKYGVETAQEPVVALTPEPDGTAVSSVLLRLYCIADGSAVSCFNTKLEHLALPAYKSACPTVPA